MRILQGFSSFRVQSRCNPLGSLLKRVHEQFHDLGDPEDQASVHRHHSMEYTAVHLARFTDAKPDKWTKSVWLRCPPSPNMSGGLLGTGEVAQLRARLEQLEDRQVGAASKADPGQG